MVRRYRPRTSLHGFKWNLPGIYLCRHHVSKPFRVKFKRNGIDINVGYFATLLEATRAAELFLRNDQCPPPPPAKHTPTSTPSSIEP